MNTKKRNVLQAAQRLFIEKGFRSTTVNDIIEEANVSKGTFYNYFSSKNECIIAILENARKETLIKRKRNSFTTKCIRCPCINKAIVGSIDCLSRSIIYFLFLHRLLIPKTWGFVILLKKITLRKLTGFPIDW